MALNQETSAFKAALARQDYSSWHSQPPALKPEDAESAESPKKKQKKAKSNVVFSQPADTGTGTNVNTQLVYLVNELKTSHNPRRLDDIAMITEIPVDTDHVLMEKFRAHDRVQWDPKTDLYSYKHDFNFRNKASLLTEIQRHTRKGGGIPVRALKESWKEAPAAIEELEKEGDVLVTRTAKDGQLKMVFWNEIKPTEEEGGMPVEQEFMDLWHELKVPNDVDLLRQLASDGLQVTHSSGSTAKGQTTKKKGKKGANRQRQIRLTNTHLKGSIDLSRDYVVPGK